MLSAWMQADQRGSESRVTSAFASALESNPAFAADVLALLGIDEDGRIVVDLEVPTGQNRNRIDVEIRVVDHADRLCRKAWIEVKLDSLLAAERGEHRSQLERYRSALDARDAVRSWLKPSPLAVLLPEVDEDRERQQINNAGAVVLTWQRVGETAAYRAQQIAGAEWRVHARLPSATLELANLETLVWLLESGEKQKGRLLVGIAANDPVDEEVLTTFSRAARALAAIEGLLDQTEEALRERKWSTNEDEDEDENEDGDDVNVFDELESALRFSATPSTGDRAWWSDESAAIEISILSANPREEAVPPDPVLLLSLRFDDPVDRFPLKPAWLERLEAAGFTTYEDPDNGHVESIAVARPLRNIVSDGRTTTEQAGVAADWIETKVAALVETAPD